MSFDCFGDFQMDLQLDPYMYQSNEQHIYQLCGIIEHQGTALDHGHYVAAVRGFDGKGWHFFDDEIVNPSLFAIICMRDTFGCTILPSFLTFVLCGALIESLSLL